jgi:hypothetical protein
MTKSNIPRQATNKNYFADLSTETTQKSSDELTGVQQKIIDPQDIFNKSEVSKEDSKKPIISEITLSLFL